MNKTYRIIFNKALGVLQVVSELAKSKGKKSSGKSSLASPDINSAVIPFKLKMIAATLFSMTIVVIPIESYAGVNGGDGGESSRGSSGVSTSGGGNGGVGGLGGSTGGTGGAGGGGAGGGSPSSGGNGGASNGGTAAGGAGGAIGVAGSSGANGGFVSAGGGGGGGAGGSGSSITGNFTGGKGGDGGPAVGLYGAGGGAGGGGVGFFVTSGSTVSNSGIVTGGAGGAGGAGSYEGGAGAGGGAGLAGSNFTIINTGSIAGGVGGAGGVGTPNGSAGSGGAGVQVLSGSGVIITNSTSGTITGGNSASGGTSGSGILVDSGASITTLTNNGSIVGGTSAYGILNNGTITTLNNRQGASSSALTFSGVLPSAYNIIVNSPTDFGKLAVTSGTGTMTFGVYNTSTLAVGRYLAVLSGVNAGNLTGSYTNQTYGSYQWSLVNTAGTTWELDVISAGPPAPSGPSLANTQASVANTAQALQGTYTLQNAVLANSFSYDCTVFGANDVCVSAGGRNTAVSAANGLNNTSGLLIAAYRPHANYRVGAYVDQNLSVNNAGSTVNLGNNTPLIGLFGAWNERLDGTGIEVKATLAYGQKNTTMNRQVVGTGATASEAGSGSSTLNSQGAQVTAKYGFAVMPEVIVSPYVGIRYTQNNMGGYTEGTSSSVTAPLTYSALNTNATTALAGLGASYKGIPKTNLFASTGVETDTNTANGSYSATGVTGLTPVNFNANPVKTRPTAMLGATYDVTKNQRLGITGIYRQEAYQAVQTTTVMATYTVGL